MTQTRGLIEIDGTKHTFDIPEDTGGMMQVSLGDGTAPLLITRSSADYLQLWLHRDPFGSGSYTTTEKAANVYDFGSVNRCSISGDLYKGSGYSEPYDSIMTSEHVCFVTASYLLQFRDQTFYRPYTVISRLPSPIEGPATTPYSDLDVHRFKSTGFAYVAKSPQKMGRGYGGAHFYFQLTEDVSELKAGTFHDVNDLWHAGLLPQWVVDRFGVKANTVFMTQEQYNFMLKL